MVNHLVMVPVLHTGKARFDSLAVHSWSYGLMVRIRAFQALGQGSIPCRTASLRGQALVG